MYHKISFTSKTKLSTPLTVIKLYEDFEFGVSLKDADLGLYQIENIKGDLEVEKIVATDYSSDILIIDQTFYSKLSSDTTYTFSISATVKMKEVFSKRISLTVSSERLKLLKLYQFYTEEFYCNGVPITYYIKKIKNTGNDIEIHIVNPYDIEIEGKKGDFKIEKSSTTDSSLFTHLPISVTIIYHPTSFSAKSQKKSSSNFNARPKKDSSHAAVTDESRPQSVTPVETSKLYKIMSNVRFADIFFISSDKEKIPSYRHILYEMSPVIAKIIDETSELPVTIDAEEFDAETIQSALKFLYGKSDSIIGKEKDVFKFSVKHKIQELMNACGLFFEESVAPSNVCEYIQIAYSNNFEELKQKCLKTVVEKKKEINSSKFADLPKNIISDVFAAF